MARTTRRLLKGLRVVWLRGAVVSIGLAATVAAGDGDRPRGNANIAPWRDRAVRL